MSGDFEFLSKLKRRGKEQFMFEPIDLGEYRLSIQASQYHYSSPRKTYSSPYDYESFEVALFEGEKWVNPTSDEKFKEIANDFKENWESGNAGVGAYIPSYRVQELYDFCKKIGGEPA